MTILKRSIKEQERAGWRRRGEKEEFEAAIQEESGARLAEKWETAEKHLSLWCWTEQKRLFLLLQTAHKLMTDCTIKSTLTLSIEAFGRNEQNCLMIRRQAEMMTNSVCVGGGSIQCHVSNKAQNRQTIRALWKDWLSKAALLKMEPATSGVPVLN